MIKNIVVHINAIAMCIAEKEKAKRRDVTMCLYPFTPRTSAGRLGLSLRLTDRRCPQAQALVPEGAPDILLEH